MIEAPKALREQVFAAPVGVGLLIYRAGDTKVIEIVIFVDTDGNLRKFNSSKPLGPLERQSLDELMAERDNAILVKPQPKDPKIDGWDV